MIKTIQGIIDITVPRMREQGCYGADAEDTACSYLTTQGKRCFVGQLAADDAEALEWESAGLSVEDIVELEVAPEIAKKAVDLLGYFQAEHDDSWEKEVPFSTFMKSMKGKIRNLGYNCPLGTA